MKKLLALVAALALLAVARATTFDLSGAGTPWHATISKTVVSTAAGRTFYQNSLSIYSGARLMYRSPRGGGPLTAVMKARGADLWFPVQEARIVGAARLMGGDAQQLVIESHESAADCGSATISIFRFDRARSKVVPAATVQNGCELTARIVGNTLRLSGPYYGPNAPMCCPTVPKATATLVYRNNVWVETPRYYALHPNAFPRT